MLSAESQSRLARTGVTLFERGWLSSNNVLVRGEHGPTALIDSGYCTHANQTIELVRTALGGRSLDFLLNTHLHSDHCGGNVAFKSHYPELITLIPPGLAEAVRGWDEEALTYAATGQQCPRFTFQRLLEPGSQMTLGAWDWEVHGAKGHDPHAVVLFQRDNRVLISADALWQNGFGVVFPELEGLAAFDEVRETLDLIESLSPAVILPGHGSAFEDLEQAMCRARSRLQQFVGDPARHLRHAHKVLIKFRLLELRSVKFEDLCHWVEHTPYLQRAVASSDRGTKQWLVEVIEDLERSQAIRQDGETVFDA